MLLSPSKQRYTLSSIHEKSVHNSANDHCCNTQSYSKRFSMFTYSAFVKLQVHSDRLGLCQYLPLGNFSFFEQCNYHISSFWHAQDAVKTQKKVRKWNIFPCCLWLDPQKRKKDCKTIFFITLLMNIPCWRVKFCIPWLGHFHPQIMFLMKGVLRGRCPCIRGYTSSRK